MADTKEKKIRIYKLATEYNLSPDSLVEFLNSKGFKVKNHMSLLEEDMIAAINAHYKKDIEKAEHHYKKLAEFHKKRAERASKEAKEEEKSDETAELPPAVESVEPETIIKATEKAVEEVAQIESEKKVEETVVEQPLEKTEQGQETKDDKEKESRIPKAKGLTVVGKMEPSAYSPFSLQPLPRRAFLARPARRARFPHLPLANLQPSNSSFSIPTQNPELKTQTPQPLSLSY